MNQQGKEFSQHILGLDPGHTQVHPGRDDSAVLFYCFVPLKIFNY